jgi:signal transduction histidine kinase
VTDAPHRDDDPRFRASLAEVLSSALDETAMLAAIARLAVPKLGDRALADLVGDDGVVERVAGGVDDWRISLTESLRAGELTVVPELTPAALASLAPDAGARAAIRDAGLVSVAVLPLRGRGRLLGVLTLGVTAVERRYRREDTPFLTDIATLAALGLDNARLYQQARQAGRARDDTLAVVSHDLRNGLNTVLTAVGLLLRSLPPDEEGRRDRKHVEAIRRSAERMNRLIGDLLDVASIEAGRLFVDPQRTAVRPLVKEAADDARTLAAEKALHLEYTVAGGAAAGLEVVCDRERVLQVLGYLIDNALKFTPEGGTVKIAADVRDDEVEFAVHDSGVGVSRKQLPHIFDRFWQATPKARLGSGLGLTIAKGVVEALGGRIWVESDEGVGTTFYFTLPRSATQAPIETDKPHRAHAQ